MSVKRRDFLKMMGVSALISPTMLEPKEVIKPVAETWSKVYILDPEIISSGTAMLNNGPSIQIGGTKKP